MARFGMAGPPVSRPPAPDGPGSDWRAYGGDSGGGRFSTLADIARVLTAPTAAMVERAYADGATFGAAFGALLKQLLPSYGLLHVDPMLPAIRELAAPTIRVVAKA